MSLLGITTVAGLAKDIIGMVIPDPQKKAEAQIKLLELEQQGWFKELDMQLQRDIEQIALNKIEAQSPNLFKSGWRPAVGWVGAIGFAYAVIVYPILTWAAVVFDITPPPNLETGILLSVLGGLLGLGGYRTYEKQAGLTK